MKFRLTTARNYYTKEDAKELEKLGFTFEVSDYHKNYTEGSIYHKRRLMKCDNDDEGIQEIEISTIDDLIEFSKKFGDLVFKPDAILIYDDYIE